MEQVHLLVPSLLQEAVEARSRKANSCRNSCCNSCCNSCSDTPVSVGAHRMSDVVCLQTSLYRPCVEVTVRQLGEAPMARCIAAAGAHGSLSVFLSQHILPLTGAYALDRLHLHKRLLLLPDPLTPSDSLSLHTAVHGLDVLRGLFTAASPGCRCSQQAVPELPLLLSQPGSVTNSSSTSSKSDTQQLAGFKHLPAWGMPRSMAHFASMVRAVDAVVRHTKPCTSCDTSSIEQGFDCLSARLT